VSLVVQELECWNELDKQLSAARPTIESLQSSLDAAVEEIRTWQWGGDPVSLMYEAVFSTDVIIDHSLTRDALVDDLRRRIRLQQPPGYKDASKSDEGVGDVAIWHSLIALGQQKKKDVVFVTGEMKSDWHHRFDHKPLFIRPELTVEFHNATEARFGIMNFTEFLRLHDAKPDTVTQSQEAIEKAVQHDLKTVADKLKIRFRLPSKKLQSAKVHLVEVMRRAQEDHFSASSTKDFNNALFQYIILARVAARRGFHGVDDRVLHVLKSQLSDRQYYFDTGNASEEQMNVNAVHLDAGCDVLFNHLMDSEF
jgi:regulator of sigma D